LEERRGISAKITLCDCNPDGRRGRKRHITVNTLGLPLVVMVTSASV
jgi:hypothetical protein